MKPIHRKKATPTAAETNPTGPRFACSGVNQSANTAISKHTGNTHLAFNQRTSTDLTISSRHPRRGEACRLMPFVNSEEITRPPSSSASPTAPAQPCARSCYAAPPSSTWSDFARHASHPSSTSRGAPQGSATPCGAGRAWQPRTKDLRSLPLASSVTRGSAALEYLLFVVALSKFFICIACAAHVC
jgi:hypothetical protein